MNTGALNMKPFFEKLMVLSKITGEEMKDLIKREARLSVYNTNPKVPGLINITPPFSEKVKDSAGALLSAQRSIDRDLAGVFMPVTIKGQRTIPHLFGNTAPNVGRKPPYKVPTKERWPDVAAIHKQRWESKNANRSKVMTRGQRDAGQKKQGYYYVDAIKLSIVRKEAYAVIGLACSCWWVAAQQLGLTPSGVPPWVKRHSSSWGKGRVLDDTVEKYTISISSSLPYNARLDMESKLQRVLGYRERALESSLPYILAAAVRKAKLAA